MKKSDQIIFLITYKDGYGHHTYQRYFISKDGYCGDRKMIKILNMLHYCGDIMTDEDYKEFVVNAGDRENFEIEDVEIIKDSIEL